MNFLVFPNQETQNHFPFLNVVTLVRAIALQDRMVLAYEASKAQTGSLFRASMNNLKANKEAPWKGLNDSPRKLWESYADLGNITWNQHDWGQSKVIIGVLKSYLHCSSHNSGAPYPFAQIRVRPIQLRYVPSRVYGSRRPDPSRSKDGK